MNSTKVAEKAKNQSYRHPNLHPHSKHGYEEFTDSNDSLYRKIVFKNDVMVGALFIGNTEDPGVYTYLIKNRIPLGKLKRMAILGTLGASAQGKKAKKLLDA